MSRTAHHHHNKGSDIKFCSCHMCKAGIHRPKFTDILFLRRAIRHAVKIALHRGDIEKAESLSQASAGYTD